MTALMCSKCGEVFDSDVVHDCKFYEIPASERNIRNASYAMLCREDKEQLDRIEAMLKQLVSIIGPQSDVK